MRVQEINFIENAVELQFATLPAFDELNLEIFNELDLVRLINLNFFPCTVNPVESPSNPGRLKKEKQKALICFTFNQKKISYNCLRVGRDFFLVTLLKKPCFYLVMLKN